MFDNSTSSYCLSVCLSFHGRVVSHITITHDALDLTIQGQPLSTVPDALSVYRDPCYFCCLVASVARTVTVCEWVVRILLEFFLHFITARKYEVCEGNVFTGV